MAWRSKEEGDDVEPGMAKILNGRLEQWDAYSRALVVPCARLGKWLSHRKPEKTPLCREHTRREHQNFEMLSR